MSQGFLCQRVHCVRIPYRMVNQIRYQLGKIPISVVHDGTLVKSILTRLCQSKLPLTIANAQRQQLHHPTKARSIVSDENWPTSSVVLGQNYMEDGRKSACKPYRSRTAFLYESFKKNYPDPQEHLHTGIRISREMQHVSVAMSFRSFLNLVVWSNDQTCR